MAEHDIQPGTGSGPGHDPIAERASRHGTRNSGQPEYDVSKMHTTLLGEIEDISRMHTSLLTELPEAPALPRAPGSAEPPRVTRPEPPHVMYPEPRRRTRPGVRPVTRPERTNYLARQSSAPLALPELPDLPPLPPLPPLPESGRLPQGPGGSNALSGLKAEAEARERKWAQAQREANAAEAARWRRHADEVSEQIRHDTKQFTTMTARWRTLVHMTRRSQQEDMERARLEVEVPRLSQRLARARKRWTECLAHARECEARAAR